MRLSARQQDAIAEVARVLLEQHANEWTHRYPSLLSFTIRSTRQGFFLVMRALHLNPKRFASARIILTEPRDNVAWLKLRRQLMQRGLSKLSDAKYRYLFVPAHVWKRASRELVRTRVSVVSLGSDSRGRSKNERAVQLAAAAVRAA